MGTIPDDPDDLDDPDNPGRAPHVKIGENNLDSDIQDKEGLDHSAQDNEKTYGDLNWRVQVTEHTKKSIRTKRRPR